VADAANVLRIGAVLDAPPLCCDVDEVDIRAGSTPLVLVSLSTSEQGQADLLQRCVDAVASLPVHAVVTTGPDRFADRHVVGAWKERASQWGCVNQIALPLHLGDCSHRVFVLGRSETFSPAEMQTARRLQRLLLGLDRQVLALSGAAGARPGLLSRATERYG
jgi:hypothetical protein